MMKQRTFFFIWILSTSTSLFAQEQKVWTLHDCLEYALDKNIQLQQNIFSMQESEIDVKNARAALFPSLSFSTGHNLINRPYQENSNTVSGTEIISSNNRNTYNGNYSLNAQWTLWNSGKRLRTLKQQKLNLDIAQLGISETQNMLQEEITKVFVQILYADESVAINKSTLEVSEATYARGKELFAEGSISKADLAQLEAQTSNDKYQVITAESTLRSYKLQLKQLLELEGTEEMTLALPTIQEEQVTRLLPAQEEIYQSALSTRPEIQSCKFEVENARLSIANAQSGYMPTLSLSASTSSTTNSASVNNWAQQMKYGWNNMIGISLSVPLFDNRQNKSNVQKARIQYSNSQLDLINRQKELYSTIQSLWLDALNAQQQYLAARDKLKSCRTSFDMVNEQFSLGMRNTVELLTEKNNLLNAQQQQVQAKYMAVLSRTLLNFYAGQNIEL